ncbi:MAG: hypothetical protein ACRDYZ_03740 [Acidimicrobiales bacterium]
MAATDLPSVPRVGTTAFERLKDLARLQALARATGGRPPHELLAAPGPGTGLAALPEPDPADLFFDIEGDPFAADGGLEYLLGVAWTGSGEPRYGAMPAMTAIAGPGSPRRRSSSAVAFSRMQNSRNCSR